MTVPEGAAPATIRRARAAEVEVLARLWHDGWQDAHAAILPAELARLRTLDSFRERLRAALTHACVAEVGGAPVGFCIVEGDELYQLFVAPRARGTGAAAALVADAEARMAAVGVRSAWLACAIGNDRAARFYEKCGWHLVGNMISRLPTPEGVFQLEVWRFEKSLASPLAPG
ncbi:MAG TPA: GNAT family N-acetyltransferase [Luteimonas sp.]|nr:GNAT family N-acetyltransferase [Luteimonas sp.]